MASCLDDSRVTVFVGDGIKYMKEHKGEFDVIITDAPDPIGQQINSNPEISLHGCVLDDSGYPSHQARYVCLLNDWYDLKLDIVSLDMRSTTQRCLHYVAALILNAALVFLNE